MPGKYSYIRVGTYLEKLSQKQILISKTPTRWEYTRTMHASRFRGGRGKKFALLSGKKEMLLEAEHAFNYGRGHALFFCLDVLRSCIRIYIWKTYYMFYPLRRRRRRRRRRRILLMAYLVFGNERRAAVLPYYSYLDVRKYYSCQPASYIAVWGSNARQGV